MRTFKTGVTVRWPVTEQELLAPIIAKGMKLTPAVRSIAKLIPQLSHAELKDFCRWAELEELVYDNPNPERRRELLSGWDSCPCCGGWLGHNHPPAGDPEPEPPPPRKRKPEWPA